MFDTGGIATICSNLVEACFGNRSRQKCPWQLPSIPDDSRAHLDDSRASPYNNSASQKTAEASIEFRTAMVAGPWVFLESSERSIPWKIEASFGDRNRQKRSWQRPTIWYCSSLYGSRASQKTAETSIKFSTAMVAGPWAAVPASPYRGDGCGRRAFWILNLVAHSAKTGLAMASGFFAPNRGRGDEANNYFTPNRGGGEEGPSGSVWPQADVVPAVRL
jgi:hypothetical protein